METVLREKIAGEITLSEAPGATMRKWREEFQVSQSELARFMHVSPSVVSDYESGRRRSPGILTVRKLVDAMLAADTASGRRLQRRFAVFSDVIPSMREFTAGMKATDFLRRIEGRPLTRDNGLLKRTIYGFTLIDSIKAITTLDANDYLRIYGSSSERALLFTSVKYGRSPMVAIKAHPLKPAIVVYVQPENVDDLALKLAELSNILLARTDLETNDLIERLERLP